MEAPETESKKVIRLEPKKPLRVEHKAKSVFCVDYWCSLKYNMCTYYPDPCDPDAFQRHDGVPGFLVHQGVDTFHVMYPIASASASASAYLAQLWSSYSKDRFRHQYYVIRCVNGEKEPHKERALRADVARSRTLRRRDRCFGPTSSVIECVQQFYHGAYYCCVLPDVYQRSLRLATMADLSPHGFPEHDGRILFVLYKTLQALDVLHRLGHAHGELCAAHIYLSCMSQVKLGFAASMLDLWFDEEGKDSVSPYMPAASLCRWAAAPEVYGGAAATKEGDMWLVGMTALELAYGGLRVTSRKELESVVMKINVEKMLPKKLNETDENKNKNPLFPFCCLNRSGAAVFPLGGAHGCKKRVFSKGFVNLVVSCLDFRPEMRPTAAQLLCHDVFKRVESWHFLPTLS